MSTEVTAGVYLQID